MIKTKKNRQLCIGIIIITAFMIQSINNPFLGQMSNAEIDNTSPDISNVIRSDEYFKAQMPNKISCEVFDESIIDIVILHYYVDMSPSAVAMKTHQYNIYSANIPKQELGSTIYYKIEATDIHNNSIITDNFGPFEVFDGFKPEITNIDHSPFLVTNLDSVTIEATVTDNIEVELVTLKYWKNYDVSYTILSMTSLSESEYEVVIPQQETNTKITYQIVAVDNSFLNNTAYSTKEEYYVTDGLHPFILVYDIIPTPVPTNSPFTVYIEAFDYDGIASVEIHYWESQTQTWYVDYPTYLIDNYWEYEFNGYPENSNVLLYCVAEDNGPEHHTTTTESYNVIIYDSIKPAISNIVHDTDLSYTPGKRLQINATIEDASEVSTRIVYYTFYNGTHYVKRGTFLDRIPSTDTYIGTIEMHDPRYECNYWIFAEDSSGNEATSENTTITYYDGIAPTITNTYWGPINSAVIDSQTSVIVNCSVVDDNLDTVAIQITAIHINGITIYNQTHNMIPIIGYENYYEYVIQNFTDLTTVIFTIIATDNTTYNGEPLNNTAIFEEQFQVSDTHEPQILYVNCDPIDTSEITRTNITVADINELDRFTVIYGIKVGTQYTWLTETIFYDYGNNQQVWTVTLSYPLDLSSYTGELLAIKITVYDTSGHLTEGTYCFTIRDITPPSVQIVNAPTTVLETEDCIILLEISDNSEIIEAKAGFTINYGAETYITLIDNFNGTYTCIIPENYNYGDALVISFYVTDQFDQQTQLHNILSYAIGDGLGPEIFLDTLEAIDSTVVGYNNLLTIRTRIIDDSVIQSVTLHWITYAHDGISETISGTTTFDIDFYESYNYSVTVSSWDIIHVANIDIWIKATDSNGMITQGDIYTIWVRDTYAPTGYITNLSEDYFDLPNIEYTILANVTDDTALNLESTHIELWSPDETTLIFTSTTYQVIETYSISNKLVEYSVPLSVLETLSQDYYNMGIKIKLIVDDSSEHSSTYDSGFITKTVQDTYVPIVVDDNFDPGDLNPQTTIQVYLPIIYDISIITVTATFSSTTITTQDLITYYDGIKEQYYVDLPEMPALDSFWLSVDYDDGHGNNIIKEYTDTIDDLANPIIHDYSRSGDPLYDNVPILFLATVTDDGYIYEVNLIITINDVNISYTMNYNAETGECDLSLELEKGTYIYYIEAIDGSNPIKITTVEGGTFVVFDNTSPWFVSISDISNVYDKSPLVIDVIANDNNGISKIILDYKINDNPKTPITVTSFTYVTVPEEGYKATFYISEMYFVPSDTITITKITIEDDAETANVIEIEETPPLPSSWIVQDITDPSITDFQPSQSHIFNSGDTISFWCKVLENDINNLNSLDTVVVRYKHGLDSVWIELALGYQEIISTEVVKYGEDISSVGLADGAYDFYFYVLHNGLDDYEGDATTPHTFTISDATPPTITSVSHTPYDNIQDSSGWYDFVITISAIEYETFIENDDVYVYFKIGVSGSWAIYGTVTTIVVDGNTYTITYTLNWETIRSFVKDVPLDDFIYYKIHVEDFTNNFVEITGFGTETEFRFDIDDRYAPQSSVRYLYTSSDIEWISTIMDDTLGYKACFRMDITITDEESYLYGAANIKIYYKYGSLSYLHLETIDLEHETSTSCIETIYIDLDDAAGIGLTEAIYNQYAHPTDKRLQLFFKVEIEDKQLNKETEEYSIYVYDLYDPIHGPYNTYDEEGTTIRTDGNPDHDGRVIIGGETNVLKVTLFDGSDLTSEEFKIELCELDGTVIVFAELNTYLSISKIDPPIYGEFLLKWQIDWAHYLEGIDPSIVQFKFKIYILKDSIWEQIIETDIFYLVHDIVNYDVISGGVAIEGAVSIFAPGDTIEGLVTLSNVLYDINIDIYYRYFENGDNLNDNPQGIDDDDIDYNSDNWLESYTCTPNDGMVTIESFSTNDIIYTGKVVIYLKIQYTWETTFWWNTFETEITSIDNSFLVVTYKGDGVNHPEITLVDVNYEDITDIDWTQKLYVEYDTSYTAELDYILFADYTPDPNNNPDDNTDNNYWCYVKFNLVQDITSITVDYYGYLTIESLTFETVPKKMHVRGYIEVSAEDLYGIFEYDDYDKIVTVTVVLVDSYDNGKVSNAGLENGFTFTSDGVHSTFFRVLDAWTPIFMLFHTGEQISYLPTSFDWNPHVIYRPYEYFAISVRDVPEQGASSRLTVTLKILNLQSGDIVSHELSYTSTYFYQDTYCHKYLTRLYCDEIGSYNSKYYFEVFDRVNYAWYGLVGGYANQMSYEPINTANMLELDINDVIDTNPVSVKHTITDTSIALSSTSYAQLTLRYVIDVGEINPTIKTTWDGSTDNTLFIIGHYYWTGDPTTGYDFEIGTTVLDVSVTRTNYQGLPTYEGRDYYIQLKFPTDIVWDRPSTLCDIEYHIDIKYVDNSLGIDCDWINIYSGIPAWPTIHFNDDVAPLIDAILITPSYPNHPTPSGTTTVLFRVFEASAFGDAYVSITIYNVDKGASRTNPITDSRFTFSKNSLGLNSKSYSFNFVINDFIFNCLEGQEIIITISVTADGDTGASDESFILGDSTPPVCIGLYESTHPSTNLLLDTDLQFTDESDSLTFYVYIYDADSPWDSIIFCQISFWFSLYDIDANYRSISSYAGEEIDDNTVKFTFHFTAAMRVMYGLPIGSTDKGIVDVRSGAWAGAIVDYIKIKYTRDHDVYYNEFSYSVITLAETEFGESNIDMGLSTFGPQNIDPTTTNIFDLYYTLYSPPYNIWGDWDYATEPWPHYVFLQYSYDGGTTWIDVASIYTSNSISDSTTLWHIQYSLSYSGGYLPETYRYSICTATIAGGDTYETDAFALQWTDTESPVFHEVTEMYGDPVPYDAGQLLQVKVSDNWYIYQVKVQYYTFLQGSPTSPISLWMNYFSGSRYYDSWSTWRQELPENLHATVNYRFIVYDPIISNAITTDWYDYWVTPYDPGGGPFDPLVSCSMVMEEGTHTQDSSPLNIPYTIQELKNDHNLLQYALTLHDVSGYGTITLTLQDQGTEYYYPMRYTNNAGKVFWQAIISLDKLVTETYNIDMLWHSYFGFTKSFVKDYHYGFNDLNITDTISPLQPIISYNTENNLTRINITTQGKVLETKILYKYQNDKVWQSISFFKKNDISLSLQTVEEIEMYIETYIDSISRYHLQSEKITLYPNITATQLNHDHLTQTNYTLIIMSSLTSIIAIPLIIFRRKVGKKVLRFLEKVKIK